MSYKSDLGTKWWDSHRFLASTYNYNSFAMVLNAIYYTMQYAVKRWFITKRTCLMLERPSISEY